MFECALGMQYLHGVSSLFIHHFRLATTLIAVCQREIIHGSLKPTNILIAENGQACIADYGMIEIKHSGSACARYFSPEAWKGVCLYGYKSFYFLIMPLSDDFPTFGRVCICDELI